VSMKHINRNPNLIHDSRPSVMLTVGEFRELLRHEIHAAFSKHSGFGVSQNDVSLSQESDIPPYLTVKEAADVTRLAPSTIRLFIRKGELKAQKVGRRIILRRAEIEKLLGCSNKVVNLFPLDKPVKMTTSRGHESDDEVEI
jgi:excisionase family DNA binding protein